MNSFSISVDFLEMDAYHGLNAVTLTTNLHTLAALSKELKKPSLLLLERPARYVSHARQIYRKVN